jgi:hypothetical protein
MRLWVASLSSAYHAVGEISPGMARVAVRLADIPATCTRLSFWAPRCAPLTVQIAEASHPILRQDKPCGTLRLRAAP